MKKLWILVIAVLFCGCELEHADNIDDFPLVDYSTFVADDSYTFPNNTSALQLFNCFYSEYGYGEFDVTGTYSHTESAILNGETYSNTIIKKITKINISHIIDSNTSGMHVSSFYVNFITDTNETLTYQYQWQFHKDNSWKNDKTNGIIIITR